MQHFIDKITVTEFQALFHLPNIQFALSDEAKARIIHCRQYLDERLSSQKKAIYGINTGFGSLCNTQVNDTDLAELQFNLIRSHACGAGAEVPHEIVKIMLLLKARSLAFGYSGAQIASIQRLLDFYNHDCLPVVYTQGSLGASGDLAPLAHLCLPLIGEGEVFFKGKRMSAADALAEMNWQPIALQSKEGLALLNGTQFMLSYALYCVTKAEKWANVAIKIAAMSLDAFDGKLEPFHPNIHKIRPHNGQIWAAEQMRTLLADSEIANREKIHVQDPYSFRCIPQVHGACYNAILYTKSVFAGEFDAATDNPNIFPDDDLILSGGNFHGQPLAMALDYLAIAVSELGSISERRTYQLIAGLRGLPPFLAPNAGLNSGLMIPQYTAASIASQNKQYCTPASVDTIPSSNNQEDHVSMGANAATKCYQVIENVQTLLGIELLNASQALFFRSPLKTGSELEAILAKFRENVSFIEKDRFLQVDMAKARAFVGEMN